MASSYYEKRIAQITGQSDPVVLGNIEETMRLNLSGLDHLTRPAFTRLAKESAQVCIALGAIAAAEYAAALAQGA